MRYSRWLRALLIVPCVVIPIQASVQILGNTSSLRGGAGGPIFPSGGCGASFIDERPRPVGTFTSHNADENHCVPSAGDDGPISVSVADDFTTTFDASVIEIIHHASWSFDGRFVTASGHAFTDHRLSVSFQVTEPVVAEISGSDDAGVGRTSVEVSNANTDQIILTNREPGAGGPFPRTAFLDEGIYDFEFVGSWDYYDLGGGSGETSGYGTASPVRLRFLQPEPIPEPSTFIIWSLLGVSTFLISRVSVHARRR